MIKFRDLSFILTYLRMLRLKKKYQNISEKGTANLSSMEQEKSSHINLELDFSHLYFQT